MTQTATIATKYTSVTNLIIKEVVLGSADTESAVIDLNGMTLGTIFTPATLTATTLNIYTATKVDGTYVPLNFNDEAVSATVTTSNAYSFEPVKTCGVRFVKINVAASEGADRTFTLTLRTAQ